VVFVHNVEDINAVYPSPRVSHIKPPTSDSESVLSLRPSTSGLVMAESKLHANVRYCVGLNLGAFCKLTADLSPLSMVLNT